MPPVDQAAIDAFTATHQVPLPAALTAVYRQHGAATIGGFLHLERPEHITTHRERIGHLLDPGDEELIADTADVLVFGVTDNGDLLGWHGDELRAGVDAVVRLIGFDEVPLAGSTAALLSALRTEDLFGVGVLPATYT